tara:strand:- start:1216 stop:1473 length:258 start_codon:yes stop_codon:yes gene_type:complete
MNRPDQAAFGQFGNAYEAGTTAVTPPSGKVIVAISVLADASLTCVSENTDFGTLTGVAVPAGVTVYGRYTSVTPDASGRVICYFG